MVILTLRFYLQGLTSCLLDGPGTSFLLQLRATCRGPLTVLRISAHICLEKELDLRSGLEGTWVRNKIGNIRINFKELYQAVVYSSFKLVK